VLLFGAANEFLWNDSVILPLQTGGMAENEQKIYYFETKTNVQYNNDCDEVNNKPYRYIVKGHGVLNKFFKQIEIKSVPLGIHNSNINHSKVTSGG